MKNLKNIVSDREVVRSIGEITQAYQEISVIKMQRIRSGVMKTRAFAESLADIFFDVKSSYKKQIEEYLGERKKGFHFPFHHAQPVQSEPKKEQEALVFLGANTRLHGDIINRTFQSFVEELKKSPTASLVLVGRVAKDLYESAGLQKAYTFFETRDEMPLESVLPVVYHLKQFQKITVFYGQFFSIMRQEPHASSVSGDQPLRDIPEENQDKKFLFEPSLEKILYFFETQVFGALFTQTMQEGQLARLGSRIVAMEQAQNNITGQSRKLTGEYKRLRARQDGKKQVERLAGMRLWK